MANIPEQRNQRQFERVSTSLPIELTFGTQITLSGHVSDVSLKSAFVKLKHSIYLEEHDEFSFVIRQTVNGFEKYIQGTARISRIAKGEGIAIFFRKIDDDSAENLNALVEGKKS